MDGGFYYQVLPGDGTSHSRILEVKSTERIMLKYILLASAMTISFPVLAQDKPAEAQAAPVTQAAPVQTVSPVDQAMSSVTPAADQAAPQEARTDQAQTAQAQTAQAAPQPAPADPAAAPAQTAAAQPATKADQIAQVVSTEFPSYDKDSNGSLNEAEFGAWMVALKKASDPTTKADSAATKAWVDQAFASADTDKNKSLSKAELTGFLTKGS
ncbi:EF-hand domain-containing protein [Sphingomonas sp. QA11]|uniref:EF-hand domain-containing protein n=1 Tax=Sphingomonas sp. QA11 TaxID=2950605 RepID=UPI00234BFC58|nr:EF-hand domain-containing protein [Sphingomonas sp. QA11]WCM28118.1 EF-hand domain-containing protein [Sphingomonas sp. QA11]